MTPAEKSEITHRIEALPFATSRIVFNDEQRYVTFDVEFEWEESHVVLEVQVAAVQALRRHANSQAEARRGYPLVEELVQELVLAELSRLNGSLALLIDEGFCNYAEPETAVHLLRHWVDWLEGQRLQYESMLATYEILMQDQLQPGEN